MQWLLRVMEVAAEISVPGTELWKGMLLPEDCDVPQFVPSKGTLISILRDREEAYLSDNRIMTRILGRISQEGSYEMVQKFVVSVMKGSGCKHVPTNQPLFSGPSQLFGIMRSLPGLVQTGLHVDVHWVFLLFVVRTAQNMGLMSAAEDIPFSEVAWCLLNDLHTYLACTEQTKSLREDVKNILDSISASCICLGMDMCGMRDRKTPLATLYKSLNNSPHTKFLKDKINELKKRFELFCRMENSDFDMSLTTKERWMLHYSITRSYGIIRAMVDCIVSANVDKKGDLTTEFRQTLSKLSVGLLMHTLKYNLDYKDMENIVMDGLKNAQSKSAPWDSVDLKAMTFTLPEGIHDSKRELLAALIGLSDAVGLPLPGMAGVQRPEKMDTDAVYFHLLSMASEGTNALPKLDELCRTINALETKERLMKVRGMVSIAYVSAFGFALTFIILLL